MRIFLMSHEMKTVIGWKAPEADRRGTVSDWLVGVCLAWTETEGGGECKTPEVLK